MGESELTMYLNSPTNNYAKKVWLKWLTLFGAGRQFCVSNDNRSKPQTF